MTKALLAATLASFAFGCVDQPDLASTGGISFEAFKARTYREPSSGLYVLDWDTVASGDDELRQIWEATQQGALAVLNTGGVDVKWDATQRKNLTYCISNAFGTNKQAVIDAMRTASDNGWEMMADVNYTYVPSQDASCTASNTSVMFDVNPVNANGEYIARSFFPDSPRAERNVLIDSSAFDPVAIGDAPLPNILAHELGHTLGFRHEHIRPEANASQCVEDNDFRALTPYDSASVMHYPQCNGTATTLAFTQRDRDGVIALYGAPGANTFPMAQVTAPADGATVAPTFEVDAEIVDGDLARAELYIDGNMHSSMTTGPFVFQVTELVTGHHTLDIVATDAANQTTTKTVAIVVSKTGTGGTGSAGEGDDAYGDVTGGCNAGGGAAGLPAVMFALGLCVRRRRAR